MDDLTRTSISIWISAPPRAVFECWTRAEMLSRWFQHEARNTNADGVEVTEAATGDAYEWRLAHGHVSRGHYVEVKPDTLVRFTFGPAAAMTTTVRFEPRDDGTLVQLVHEGMPSDGVAMHVDVKTGWTFYLTSLKAWVEHGVDLREHDTDRIRAGVLNV